MTVKPFLNQALQIGPWRIARKHLLFIIIFSLVVVIFGFLVLQTHLFESKSGYDSDDDDEDDDEDEDEDGVHSKFVGGDWLMVAIMTLSACMAIIAGVVCMFAKDNTPTKMRSRTSSVYTVQYNKDSKAPINSVPRASYTTPQPINALADHILKQIQQQQLQQQQIQQQQLQQQQLQQQQIQQQQLQQQQQIQQQQLQNQAAGNPVNQVQTSSTITAQVQQSPAATEGQDASLNQSNDQSTSQINSSQRVDVTTNPAVPNQIRVELPPPYSP